MSKTALIIKAIFAVGTQLPLILAELEKARLAFFEIVRLVTGSVPTLDSQVSTISAFSVEDQVEVKALEAKAAEQGITVQWLAALPWLVRIAPVLWSLLEPFLKKTQPAVAEAATDAPE